MRPKIHTLPYNALNLTTFQRISSLVTGRISLHHYRDKSFAHNTIVIPLLHMQVNKGTYF